MEYADVLTIVGGVGTVLCFVFIGIRFYARRKTKALVGWDDWFILVSGITLLATEIIILTANYAHPNGVGPLITASDKDIAQNYTQHDVLSTKLTLAANIIYFTTVSATKLSILLMYNRIFSVSKHLRYQIIFLAALTSLFWAGTTIGTCLNCIPMKYLWIMAEADPRHCINYNTFWLGCGVAECAVDLLIILMPAKAVYGLKLSRGKKIAIAAVFNLGLFSIVSGILKVTLSYIPGSRQPDFNSIFLWSGIHIYTGVICACLPVCWPVFLQISNCKWLSRSKPTVSNQSQWYGSNDDWSPSRSSRQGVQSQNEIIRRSQPQTTSNSDVHELLICDPGEWNAGRSMDYDSRSKFDSNEQL